MKKLIMTLVIALAGASFAAHHYYSKYAQQKQANKNQLTEIQQLTDTITYQNTHIDMLHEMDIKHTQRLANAKTEIDTLRADVAAGRRKLRIQASCPVSKTVTSGGVVNATTVELTGEAGQAVLDIREGIINDRAKLRYLQDYINTESGRKNSD